MICEYPADINKRSHYGKDYANVALSISKFLLFDLINLFDVICLISRINLHSAKSGASFRGDSVASHFRDFLLAESAPNAIVCGRL